MSVKKTTIRSVAIGLTGLLVAGLVTTAPAVAAPVSQITTQWAAGTPATSASGEVVNTEVRLNVNDDQAAPDDTAIENFTATFTTSNGKFTTLPDSCLITGVDPVSSISVEVWS